MEAMGCDPFSSTAVLLFAPLAQLPSQPTLSGPEVLVINVGAHAGEFRRDQAPPAIAELVDKCLDDEPAKRPTAQQVLDILLANEPGGKLRG